MNTFFANVFPFFLIGSLPLLYFNFHARFLFVACGLYRKGKSSFNKSKKYYKKRWNIVQRFLLIPLLQESNSRGYVVLFFLHYFNCFCCVASTIIHTLYEFGIVNLPGAQYYCFFYYLCELIEVFLLLELPHDNTKDQRWLSDLKKKNKK
jgi:hypothetical protein